MEKSRKNGGRGEQRGGTSASVIGWSGDGRERQRETSTSTAIWMNMMNVVKEENGGAGCLLLWLFGGV